MAPKGVAPAPDAKPSADLMAKGSNNERIHSMLLELAETAKVKGDKMRSGAYYKAAASVKKCDEMITSGKQASKLEGVGKKIAEKIDELLTTGAPWRLEPPRAARRALCLLYTSPSPRD